MLAYYIRVTYTKKRLKVFGQEDKKHSRFRKVKKVGLICFRTGLLLYTYFFKDIWYLLTYPHYNGLIAGVLAFCVTSSLYNLAIKITLCQWNVFTNMLV